MPICCLLVVGLHASESDGLVADLVIPAVEDGAPVAGKRVRQFTKDYVGSGVYHTLYLPSDWEKGKNYPVIVEYAGNRWKHGAGTVESCKLGYGVSAGKGVIWLCLPYVDPISRKNAPKWWGDVDATVAYCKEVVPQVCRQYGGDPSKVILAGFSRGAIACNYIGLHDDQIASLWWAFICHSHYDGVRDWGYKEADQASAAKRLKRLGGRPQFISHETSVAKTQAYLERAAPSGNFTYQAMSFPEHSDQWVLKDGPERAVLRAWVKSVSGRCADQ